MKKIKNFLLMLNIAFWVWGGASWLEIIAKNLQEHPTYSPWNLFILLFTM